MSERVLGEERAGYERRRERGTHGGHERLDELRRVGDEELEVLVDLEDGHDGVLADVAVAVLEARAAGRDQGLEQLGLADLLEEAQRRAPDVLVRVLLRAWERGLAAAGGQIGRGGRTRSLRMALLQEERVSAGRGWHRERLDAPDEDHLLLELAVLVVLGADLPVEPARWGGEERSRTARARVGGRRTHWRSFLICLLLLGRTNWMMGMRRAGCVWSVGQPGGEGGRDQVASVVRLPQLGRVQGCHRRAWEGLVSTTRTWGWPLRVETMIRRNVSSLRSSVPFSRAARRSWVW